MLNSKFDLYKPEWLELVFKDRNQQYGAYEIRAHYNNVMVRAMAVTFFCVAFAAGAITIISHNKPIEIIPSHHETGMIINIDPPVIEKPKIAQPKHTQNPPAAKAAPAVPTQVFVPMKVVAGPVPEEIKPINNEIAVGPEEIKTAGPGTQNVPVGGKIDGPGGTGTGTKPNNEIQDFNSLEVMPEPVGGAGAWAKFLQKNMRFPVSAQEDGVSGKVFLSFIIEKDGHLSDITVIRKAGYGFDEEALRVLKLAPAWKPGIQNGQPVRVRYTIPINFQLNN